MTYLGSNGQEYSAWGGGGGGHAVAVGGSAAGGGGGGVSITVPSPPQTVRAKMLAKAGKLIDGDRDSAYGPPTENFARIARLMTAQGYRAPDGGDIQPHDVAVLQMLTKVGRIAANPGKEDNWLDTAGYSGCGWECASNVWPIKDGE